MVDPVYGPYRGFDADRLYENDRLRRHPRRLPKIRCPTLVITTDSSGLASVEETRAWQQQIPNSTSVVLPGNSYHVAATHAERGAAATLDFIAGHPSD